MPPQSDKPSGESALGELAIIDRIRRRASSPARTGLRLGIGDDCALLSPRAGEELAVTTDLSIAGRHFLLERHPAEAIGHRALARGLSDLAAMGARPVAAFLSIALPRDLVRDIPARKNATVVRQKSGRQSQQHAWQKLWIDRFLDGFLALADATGTPLAGGDLAESPLFAADVVLIGAVRRGQALLRSGARPGHLLYVTGSLGGSVVGLRHLLSMKGTSFNSYKGSQRLGRNSAKRTDADLALKPHLWPTPRIAQGQWLARRSRATAAIDVSDGLSTDLVHLCQESDVSVELDARSIPIAPGASLDDAIHGGEDYELLFTAPAAIRLPRSIAGIPITQIGRIMRRRAGKPQITLITADGARPLEPAGWEHFA